MSVQYIQSNIERLQREIQSLHQKLTTESSNEASKNERILQTRQSAARASNLSTIQSKVREVEGLERDIISIQKRKADITKQISDKTANLHNYQQQLFREQEREQKKFFDSLKRKEEETKRNQDRLLSQLNPGSRQSFPLGSRQMFTLGSRQAFNTKTPAENINAVTYDAFISHASEDKEEIVRPLAERLRELEFSVWYDDFELRIGDSLRRSIDKGLANSKFGIVVLSPAFFSKNWPQYELDGLVAKEMSGGKVILPLWHKISKDEVISYSPPLADKLALNTAQYTIEELAQKLGEVLK
jgi:hypothetical protein